MTRVEVGVNWGARFRLGAAGITIRRARDPADASQAEASFNRALAIAGNQNAKSWELRAALSLGRLWRRQGKREDMGRLLRGIHGWFTEGFETADLREAQMVLDELAAD